MQNFLAQKQKSITEIPVHKNKLIPVIGDSFKCSKFSLSEAEKYHRNTGTRKNKLIPVIGNSYKFSNFFRSEAEKYHSTYTSENSLVHFRLATQ